jgi:hypothetical protein
MALTESEISQYTDTIQMFEVITQGEASDIQALDILKEAYSKLDRHKDALATSKKIAKAYAEVGQYSNAMFEYEWILDQNPGDEEAEAALAAINNQAEGFSSALDDDDDDDDDDIQASMDMVSVGGPLDVGGGRAPGIPSAIAKAVGDDGKNNMRKLFVDSGKVASQEFEACWPDPERIPSQGQVNDSFIQNLADKQILPIEDSLNLMCGKNRFAYIPLDKYEVDAEMARTYPGELCRRWMVLPIDRMSKSILVATSNPYNKAAAKQLEDFSKSRVIWYVASPVEIQKVVAKFL